jgi:AraC-like DNA-binding protein
MTAALQIPLIYGRVIFAAASRSSADGKRLLDCINIDWKQRGQWDAGLTLDEYRSLLRGAEMVSGEASVLLDAGAGMPLSAHGPIANAIGCAPDRMTALHLLTRFIKLRGFFCEVQLKRRGAKTYFYITISEELGDEKEPALDFILGAILHGVMFQKLLPIARPEIQLTRTRPVEEAYYRRVLNASISYDRPQDCVIFDTSDLELPLPTYDSDQFEVAVKKCQMLLVEELKLASRRDAIEQIFERSPGMLWTIRQVAQALHTSSRTLQRQLAKEGTNYQAVLDDWLKQLASKYMEGEQLSVEATATLLGYQDEANFRRAFKRWYGCSPRTYREKPAGL